MGEAGWLSFVIPAKFLFPAQRGPIFFPWVPPWGFIATSSCLSSLTGYPVLCTLLIATPEGVFVPVNCRAFQSRVSEELFFHCCLLHTPVLSPPRALGLGALAERPLWLPVSSTPGALPWGGAPPFPEGPAQSPSQVSLLHPQVACLPSSQEVLVATG